MISAFVTLHNLLIALGSHGSDTRQSDTPRNLLVTALIKSNLINIGIHTLYLRYTYVICYTLEKLSYF